MQQSGWEEKGRERREKDLSEYMIPHEPLSKRWLTAELYLYG